MQLLKQQTQGLQDATRHVVQRNAYFAHRENVLAAMLTDRDSAMRDQAVAKILAPQKRKAREMLVFRVPRLNWQVKHRTNMISWCGQITEPPVTKLMSDEITSARDGHWSCPASPTTYREWKSA